VSPEDVVVGHARLVVHNTVFRDPDGFLVDADPVGIKFLIILAGAVIFGNEGDQAIPDAGAVDTVIRIVRLVDGREAVGGVPDAVQVDRVGSRC